MSKKLMSLLLVVLMVISSLTVLAMPAAATPAFTNLYDVEDALNGRAIEKMGETNTGEVIYLTSAPIEMKAGETVYFGPVNVSQGYQAYYYPKTNTDGGAQIAASSLTEVFKFEGVRCTNADNGSTKANYMAIYSYTATVDGYIRCTFPIEYAEFYVITKDAITYDTYYAYFDSIEGANLWNQFIDPKVLVNTDGALGTNTNHYATHYIAVKEGDTITWGPHQDSMYYGAFGYNANKVGVTGTIDVGSSTTANANIKKVATFTDDNNPVALDDNQTYSIYTYTVPAGVSYVRVLLRKEVPAYFQVQKNNEFDVAGYWKLMGGDMNSPYFGKNSVWFGDSICQATQDLPVNGVWYGGFVGRASKALNMIYDHNGESGWSLSTARPGRIVNRLIASQEDEPAGGYEVVMLHGGTNDAWQSVPVGSMSGSYSPADFNINTYGGALEELFYYATTLYGDTAEINYILNYEQPKKMSGQVYAMDPHYALALRICEKWGVTPIDLYHDEAVREACALDTMKIYRDWCHATQRGYEIVSPFVVDKMLAATTGNTWLEDNGTVAGKVVDSLKTTVANSAYFTEASKTAFAAAVTGANNAEKLSAALSAAPALEQVEGNYIPVFDMTKYAFAQQKDYAVSSVKDLVWLSNYNNQRGNNNGRTNFGNLPGYIPADWTIHQTVDIDMTTGTYNTNGYNAIEIGKSNPFDATYDGHGHKIINWKDGTATTDAGATCATAIFHTLKDTTLKNLTIDKAETYSSGWDALLVGRAQGNVVIENCHVTNSKMTKKSGNGLAAILLQPYDTATTSADKYLVKGCTVSNTEFVVNTTAGPYGNIGYIVSRAVTDNHKIENCYSYNNTLNITSNTNLGPIGGILGEAYKGSIKNCGTYNNVINNLGTGNLGTPGGLVGKVADGYSVSIADSYSDGALPMVGGGTVNATNCYSVQAGTTTVDAIKSGELAGKLALTTNDAWGMKEIATDVAIPMVSEDAAPVYLIEMGEELFYTDYKTGKIVANDTAAIAGKIWKYQDQTMLTADLLDRGFKKGETWTETDYLYGDCMGGDTLNTADAIAILQTLIGKNVEGYMAERADITCDGAVSVADAVRVLRYVAAGRSA